MPDLHEGETIEVRGSTSRSYEIKNFAGIYCCSCPAWRNQSLPIDQRTCKHLRAYRGDDAEQARVGTMLAPRLTPFNAAVKAPPLLLAESWDDSVDPTGWLLSEKLDGVRAYWDGKQFLSRQGNRYFAPDWFTEGLPLEPLDGELWIGRKQFQRTVNIVCRHDQSNLWKEVRFVMFDAPGEDGDLEARLKMVQLIMDIHLPKYAVVHPHITCNGIRHLQDELARIEAIGGEGLMLRHPRAMYQAGRSFAVLEVKQMQDAGAA